MRERGTAFEKMTSWIDLASRGIESLVRLVKGVFIIYTIVNLQCVYVYTNKWPIAG